MSTQLIAARVELLKMAKEIVLNEYTDIRAQDHNRWLAASEESWRTKRVKLPYPPFPRYPTTADVFKCAEVLHHFLHKDLDIGGGLATDLPHLATDIQITTSDLPGSYGDSPVSIADLLTMDPQPDITADTIPDIVSDVPPDYPLPPGSMFRFSWAQHLLAKLDKTKPTTPNEYNTTTPTTT